MIHTLKKKKKSITAAKDRGRHCKAMALPSPPSSYVTSIMISFKTLTVQ